MKKPPVRQKKSSRNKVRRRYDARLELSRKSCDAQAENEFICLVSLVSPAVFDLLANTCILFIMKLCLDPKSPLESYSTGPALKFGANFVGERDAG